MPNDDLRKEKGMEPRVEYMMPRISRLRRCLYRLFPARRIETTDHPWGIITVCTVRLGFSDMIRLLVSRSLRVETRTDLDKDATAGPSISVAYVLPPGRVDA